jgi:spore maturation protein SpmA
MDAVQGPPKRRHQGILVLLTLLATMASWLSLVPATVLAVLLLFRGRRDRAWMPLAKVMLVVVGVRGLAAARVFLDGRTLGWGKAPLPDILREMVVQVSPGTTWFALLLIPIGIAVASALRRRLSDAFLAGSLVALPLAVLAIWRFTASNGGYYINLASAFSAIAAAIALDFMVTHLHLHSSVLRVSLFAALATLATVDLPATRPRDGAANVPAFSRLIEGDSSLVVTNVRALGSLVHYHRANTLGLDLAATGWVHAHAMEDVVHDDTRSWIHLPGGVHAPSYRHLPAGPYFYLVLEDTVRLGEPGAQIPRSALLQSCTPLFPPRADATFLRCPGDVIERLPWHDSAVNPGWEIAPDP